MCLRRGRDLHARHFGLATCFSSHSPHLPQVTLSELMSAVLIKVFCHPQWNEGFSLCCDLPVAETITAGLTGTLTGVDLFLRRELGAGGDLNPIAVMVLDVKGNAPKNLLAQTSIPVSGVPIGDNLVSVDLAEFDIGVTQGRQFAIALQTVFGRPNEAGFAWFGADDRVESTYPGGAVYFRPTESSGWVRAAPSSFDLSFQTFVAAAPPTVPEPSSFFTRLHWYASAWRKLRRRPSSATRSAGNTLIATSRASRGSRAR